MRQNWRSVAGRLSKPATTRGRVDETSIKIKKVWFYLYRAIDSEGNTLEFLLSPTRDAEAATRFFLKALHSTADGAHRVNDLLPIEWWARRWKMGSCQQLSFACPDPT
jgi:transposase-like protein